MNAVRHFLAQRRLAVLLCVVTLVVKLLVPTGYMIDGGHGRIAVTLCPEAAPVASVMTDMPGMHGAMADRHAPKDHGKAEGGKADGPCAFAGLSAAATGAIDPVQLAALIAFVLALGLMAAMPPAPARPARLRPPLRGPPAFA